MERLQASASGDTVLPSYDDVVAASARLADVAVRTPLLSSPLVDERLGGRLLVKAEPLQRTGSFKFRGAWNRISLIPAGARGRGVIAFSSGNHGQGVAAAARLAGVPAVILMPSDAPAIKLAFTRAQGAEVITYDRAGDRAGESRDAIAARLAAERGLILVPPYDDAGVVAGQGTVGKEIAEQAAALGAVLDAVLVCTGGGGLVAGCALALEALSPGTAVYSVEPEGFDDHRRSLESGARCGNAVGAATICDALLSPMPGELTFAVNRPRLAGGLAVDDAQVRAAMAVAFSHYKLVVEPGGAVALAAVLSGAYDCRGKTVAVVASGGNVDPALFAAAIGGSPAISS